MSSVVGFEDPLHSANLTAADLTGSAAVVAPHIPHVDSLFSVAFARDCSLLGNMPCKEVRGRGRGEWRSN